MGPYTFRVTNDTRLLDAVSAESGRNATGFSTLEASIIAVNTSGHRSHAYQADTLLHELIHMAMQVSGYEFPVEQDEEKVVLAITTSLLHALRENPSVVTFLTYKD